MVLEPNRTVYPVPIRTAGGLPGPVAKTLSHPSISLMLLQYHYKTDTLISDSLHSTETPRGYKQITIWCSLKINFDLG